MDAYRPKQRITLSFAKRNGRKCIAAAYGGDDTLRQNLSREPGAITSKGVDAMIKACLSQYDKFLTNN